MDISWRWQSVGIGGSSVLCSLQLLLLHIKAVSLITMLTQGEKLVKNQRESIRLDCDFHEQDYNLFHCPVLWKKTQLDEITQINIMGNINDPFLGTDRYRVEFVDMAPKYRLELHIMDLIPEDSGNYTCEVRGPQSVVLDSVVHSLYVRAPVQHVFITNKQNLSELAPDYLSPSVLRLTAHQPEMIRCIAIGGYPPPSLDINVGKNSKTQQFRFRNEATLNGIRGLKVVRYWSERWKMAYIPTPSENTKRLRCVVQVPELKAVVESVRLSVDYKPRIRCVDQQANIGDLNVALPCTIDAKPRVTNYYWVLDGNGTRLRVGDVVNEVWIIADDQRDDGVIEVNLYLHEAKLRSFKSYRLEAENEVGVTSETVRLQRIYGTSTGTLNEQIVNTGQQQQPNERTEQHKYDTNNSSHSSPSNTLLVACACHLLYTQWRRLL